MTVDDKLDIILFEVQGMKCEIREIKSDITKMKSEMKDMKNDLVNIKGDICYIKGDIANTNNDIIDIQTRLNHIDETVRKNYSLTEEFFVSQMETNTEFRENIRIINGRLDKYDTQIARMPMQAKSL